jgi:aminoglycoside phosphotransferase (APT) family kinase protein
VIPSDLSFGYLSAERKSPVKIPILDLIVAWNLLSAGLCDVFRAAAGVDDATWARGQGWALSIGLIAHTYYQGKNSALVASSQRTIAEVLADHQRGS